MKTRLIAVLLALTLLLAPLLLCACQSEPEAPAEQNEEEPAPSMRTLDVNGDGCVKILALGNSFSVNAFKYLHPILTKAGVEHLTLGNLYSANCDLNKTADYTRGTGAYEIYYKYNESGARTETKNYALADALTEEDWDVITVQQASGTSGVASSYEPALTDILAYIRENRTVKDGLVAFHMTWAYEQTSTHAAFATYGKDQMAMYEAIVEATKAIEDRFDFVIPAGTAIQNARTSSFGDTMNKDGYHLNDAACVIAGYTWANALTGLELDKFPFTPAEVGQTSEYFAMARAAANAAWKTPYAVTEVE